MAFTIKTWVDRLAEFPNRRRLEPTGIENTYDVTRAEGNVTVEGDKFNAETMNNLEKRIADGFADTIQSATIGDVEVPKDGATLKFPAYPTSLPANGGNADYATTAGSAPANGGTANAAHYPSHAVGTAAFGLRGNYISNVAPSGGSDGDTWDQY